MRVLIISDTHGKHQNLIEVAKHLGHLDLCIHLGDGEGYEDYIEQILDCPLKIIAGNCDWGSVLEAEQLIELGEHRIFLTHGHGYYCSRGMEELIRKGKSVGADTVMYGHTHIPMIKKEEVLLINPGSISKPRQEGRRPSYIVLDVDKMGQTHYSLNYL
ncbi:MAG: metallophosphoesterase [Lachnospiraceae bacterium]